uniref:ZZ4 n=1 Tax=Bacillus pumilus TaxID=1408 RepID=D1MGL3_BACPU|nr:ZZ4 [Bacillus pumilus]
MHLNRCCGFSLSSKQNARALYRWHERVKNGKIKEIFVRLFCLAKVRSGRRRQSSSGNEKRSTESQTRTPPANRGVVMDEKTVGSQSYQGIELFSF